MQTRAIKNIRWILLFPLTFAVPTIVYSLISKRMSYGFNIHSLWYSIWMLAPLVAVGFIPAFLTIPTACVIAPDHRKEVSIITLTVVALLWPAAYVMILSMPTLSRATNGPWLWLFLIVELCARLLGLLAGFLMASSALGKIERGEPFFKSSAYTFIKIIVIATIPLFSSGRSNAGVVFSDLTWQENAGVVSYSFTLENKSDKPNAVAVELTAARGYSRDTNFSALSEKSIYTEEILAVAAVSTEKTRMEISLTPKEIKKLSGQFVLNPSEKGPFILVPRLAAPDSRK